MRGKFQRNYRLDVFNPSGKKITIEPPFSIKFNLTRNTLASANKANITITNLGPTTRNQIYKDRFSISEYWQVQLFAGYGNSLYQIFKGNMYEAYSCKSKTEWITQIDCFDGMDAIQNGFTSVTFEAGTEKKNIIETIVNDMPNLVAGVFGSPSEADPSPRGKIIIGQSSEALAEEVQGKYFIDGEIVNVLDDEEYIRGNVFKLDPGDLLDTPKRREAFLDILVLFQPQVKIGLLYEIESLEARFNGQYKIIGFSHSVEISSASAGKATTSLQLYFGASGLQGVTP